MARSLMRPRAAYNARPLLPWGRPDEAQKPEYGISDRLFAGKFDQ
ncbi:hypothetical protein PKB_2596 [Pseudomonas knackmussii B13]|uniref:Uncharacterized protein n=1 Tax=Pseudomonas knackmussii (strain DSM 6978 / CCUG 54928 / LMG 23759 / B13) TaxID=1301098 RepID=A0A024HHK4_PSEKB|nr:hypothetical protein PKB_2596 [Pseudomonas knackmussii B13]